MGWWRTIIFHFNLESACSAAGGWKSAANARGQRVQAGHGKTGSSRAQNGKERACSGNASVSFFASDLFVALSILFSADRLNTT
jgi:hypothetical protein